MSAQRESTDTEARSLIVAVSATFTADLVEKPLSFWFEQLELPVSLVFAPYDNTFQQLLDPSSLLRTNAGGINVVLLRLQDWYKNDDQAEFDNNVRDFIAAAQEAVSTASAELIVCICPATGLAEGEPATAAVAAAEVKIRETIGGVTGIQVVTSSDMTTSYPVDKIYEPHGERIASIPYTESFFTALGTILARRVYAVVCPPHKVIVLDCDNTLWGGLCGELGPQGVNLEPRHLVLQTFIKGWQREGKIVCLASRNNEQDVLDVFEKNRSMVLTKEDLTAWQIDWGLKSASLARLSQELGLGLDSFIFFDDDPVQCAEVQRRFPEVMALRVPQTYGEVKRFCKHIWPLDGRSTTAESQRRTDAYSEHVQRERIRQKSVTFADFLASLKMKIDVAPLSEADVARACELTQRTNQFNLTGVRATEAEVRAWLQDGEPDCHVVRVADRFGDYGLVGLFLCQTKDQDLSLPIFLLSCRALGRGVEHRMLAHAGKVAVDRDLDRVHLRCTPTDKNKPAQDFARTLVITDHCSGSIIAIDMTATDAALTNFDPSTAEIGETQRSETAPATKTSAPGARVENLVRLVSDLADIAEVHRILGQSVETEAQSESDPIEEVLTQAFKDLLSIDSVGVDDSFFDLGGHSLLAVQVLIRASAALDIELDPTLLFTTNFSIAELAEEIGRLQTTEDVSVDDVMAQLSALTDN